MSNPCAIHEGFMNPYRTILPRVGVGVRGGVGVGSVDALATHLPVPTKRFPDACRCAESRWTR